MMQRFRRVASVWSWLPAFRAVAETQHLPTASAELDVSPSALSRTIRLLETDLGLTLFERQGRRIILNEAGERLLDAVREAMRRVHDGICVVDGAELQGPVYAATTNSVAELVAMHAAAALAEASPRLVPHVGSTDAQRFVGALQRGELDVAFTTAPLEVSGLTRVRIGSIPMATYAPAEHRAASTRGSATAHAFVVWGQRPDGTSCDGWPEGLARQQAAVVHSARAALELAPRIGALVVLPDALARMAHDVGTLVQVRSKVQPVVVYAYHRHSLSTGGRAEALVQQASSAVAGGLQ